jgi:hypothetical protein
VRVPSNVDFGLNVGGTVSAPCWRWRWSGWGRSIAGAAFARSQWFVEEARGALVLLALWPFALLFPPPSPGLGQVFERLEVAISEWLLDTPFLDWLPLREFELQPLVPAVELLCVMRSVRWCPACWLHGGALGRPRAVLLP